MHKAGFNTVKYINMLMDTVYDDVTELYESLIDGEYESVNNTIDRLIQLLKETKDIHQDETDRL